MEGVSKLTHTLLLQLPGNLVIEDANVLEGSEFSLRLLDIVLEAVAHSPMIAEVLDRCERHSIYCVRADQFLRIEYIPVRRIFRARARPERSLDLCAMVL